MIHRPAADIRPGRVRHVLYEGYRRLIYVLFAVVLICLVLLAGFSTSVLQTPEEESWYCADSLLVNLLWTAAAVAAVIAAGRSKPGRRFLSDLKENERLFLRLRNGLLAAIAVVGTVLVTALRVIPEADQSMILLCAETLNEGDTTYLQLGQYLQGRQNQFGIVFLLQIYIRIFGADNYIAFQLFNVIGLTVIWYELSEIAGRLRVGRAGQLLILLFGVLFLPLSLYTTFFYGTIPGLAFALAAVRRFLKLCPAEKPDPAKIQNHVSNEADGLKNSDSSADHDVPKDHEIPKETGGLPDIILTAVYIVAACILKSNYEIFLAGIVIAAVAELIRSRKPRQLALIALTAVLFTGQHFGLKAYYNGMLEEPMADGMSAWSYVAMGLQESSYGTDGWYNGYNSHSYEDSGYDADVQEQMSKESIRERLTYFLENPAKALEFFGKKTASQWNNPLFQSEWIVVTRESEIETPAWTDFLSDSGKLDAVIRVYNCLQFQVLFGALLFLVLSGERRSPSAVLLQMIFFGGFLFHFFWEAKAQYALPYFVLLVPLAAAGYRELILRWNRFRAERSAGMRRTRRSRVP